MIKSFKITNPSGESLYLDIKKPEDTGFLIASVNGLASPEAEISSTEYALYDGSYIGSARVEARKIDFSVLFYEMNSNKYSVEELRHQCYRFFPIKKKIKIEVTNDSGTYKIDGYVEANETSIFTKMEGAEISVTCPDPYFTKGPENVVHLYHSVPMFEFPVKFENTIEFSRIESYPDVIVDYPGYGGQGITITIDSFGGADNPIVYELSRRLWIKINTKTLAAITGYGILAKDVFIITTEKGNKTAKLIRNGTTYNILSCIETGGEWISLEQGMNRFGYSVDGSNKNNLNVRIDYKTNYVGV
jgi:hypothetical protein